MEHKTASGKTRFIVTDLPAPLASASADSTCIRVKQLNNFLQAELSSGYFYTLESDSGVCDLAMGWLLPGTFGCFALPASFPTHTIPNSTGLMALNFH